MKLKLFPILLLLHPTFVCFSQELPFEIYANHRKLESSLTTYFVPVDYEFRFKDQREEPYISKGVIYAIDEEGNKKEVCRINSNTVHSNTFLIHKGKLEFEINSISMSASDTTVKIIDTLIRYSVACVYTKVMTDEEMNGINQNPISVHAKKKDLCTAGYSMKSDSRSWKITPTDHGNIEKWELILVRGNRPVRVEHFKNTSGEIDNFHANAQPGDFFRVKVTMDYTNSEGENVVFYKVIKVKE